ncbi:LRR_4 domain-containing protein/LRR_6 domain-containing protein [Cephalotus follicularis]|uniref:LRR_4 domain-containing protein/LRR_6 domain-containing protein n=1 Tax=Cephalotus follicularis TaxID=3775 RepID=A0A1Q3B6K3_CEPFO|nr:LRR_4 domain-containing protein/LRR_6 domain-containing protein [Cephalotus follicularis]
MEKLNCFCGLTGRKKKDKGDEVSTRRDKLRKGLRALQITLEHPVQPFETDELKLTAFSVGMPSEIEKNHVCNVKMMSHESPTGGDLTEVAYEGEDEQDENSSIKRELSDFDLQVHVANSGEEETHPKSARLDYSDFSKMNEQNVNKAAKGGENGLDIIQSGHVSDPGIERAEVWGSPKLKRSCSNLETRDARRKIADLLPSKSHSFEELHDLSERVWGNLNPGSPASVVSHCRADRVMLKKRSSSQILPSRSRRLWWKLFLWSHRNLHNPKAVKPRVLALKATTLNQQGGYSSDTLEPRRATELSKMGLPGSFTEESYKTESPVSFTEESFRIGCNNSNQSWNGLHSGVSGLWPQNQWVALPVDSSPFARVDEWVKDLETQPPPPIVDGGNGDDEGIDFLPSPETGRSPARSAAYLTRHSSINLPEEILHANSVIQSLNSSSTVAHISGIGLKAVPTISFFSSLRSVNLSNNYIDQITTGSLPRGLHTLNLSRNKISSIEGLRELTRLRILDISYNRISRIGHGLSNCTLIKELYLSGNKISDVEGLHRLSKLTVVDLSFNKITTTKALGQLVANYNSLVALNLLGNPIQSNISHDQLLKAVSGLLPKLMYLNKQPIKPQRAREVHTDSVAKAALGNSSWNSRRKAVKRVSQGASTSSSSHRNSANAALRRRHSSKSLTAQTHPHLPLKTLSSAYA